MTEFLRALAPVKRRIRLNRLIAGAAAGFVAGAAAALILLAVTAFLPLEHRWGIAGAVLAGGILLGALVNALRRVKNLDAARAADACGLRERAVTALELADSAAEMEQLQRRDACEHLQALDPRQIPLKLPRRLLIIGAGLLVLCAGTLLLPGSGDRMAAEHRALREKAAAMAKQVEEALSAEEAGLTEQEKAELRKLTDDLKRELSDSRDSVDALVALDKAEQRLEEFRQKTAAEAMQELADAMRSAGMDAAAQAVESGDAAAMEAELSALSSTDLQQLAEGLSAEAKELAEQLAQLAESGNLTEAQIQAMMSAAQGSPGALQQALDAMKAMLGGSGSQQGTQSGQGSGAGNGGQGQQPGGGAGTGTTNEEQKGSGNSGQNGPVKGSRSPELKETQYETIYDPEKVDTAARDVSTEQNAQGKDSVQIETGPGKGSLNGDVPYREVVGEYAETEVRAADSANLTQEQKEWVDEYFRKLTEE